MSALELLDDVDDLGDFDDDGSIDREAATEAAGALLRALGADLTKPGLHDTPRRMVEAYDPHADVCHRSAA